MTSPLIDETPAREVARLLSRLRKAAADCDEDSASLAQLWTLALKLKTDNAILRLDILLGFAECCLYAQRRVASLEFIDEEERTEATEGLSRAMMLLDPGSYGMLKRPEVLKIFTEEGLVPRVQLAAEISKEPADENRALNREKLREAAQILEASAEIYKHSEVCAPLKQLTFEFSQTCRHLIENAELFGRVGINKSINRVVSDLIVWHHLSGPVKRADTEALKSLILILSKVIQILKLEGQQGFTLSTLMLINSAGVESGLEQLNLRTSGVYPALAEFAKELEGEQK